MHCSWAGARRCIVKRNTNNMDKDDKNAVRTSVDRLRWLHWHCCVGVLMHLS